MSLRVIKFWERIQFSYWFVPMLMALGTVLLSFVFLELDRAAQASVYRSLGWLYHGGADGARAVLVAIASSMITVAGVVFSVIVLALSLASSQFGPRLLRNFIEDRVGQIAFGFFVSTFLYCLLVLRSVRDSDGEQFIPYISITFGIVLTLVSLGALIFYIHYTAVSIQVGQVVADVARDLFYAIDVLFPENLGYGVKEREKYKAVPERFEEESTPILATSTGYLQAVDDAGLLALAVKHELILCVRRRPGSFVMAGTTLMRVWPGRQLTDELVSSFNSYFILGAQRAPGQDVEFALHQLVEVALRALSPAINDPFTAMNCIDWLGAALRRLADKPLPSPYRYDADGNLRVIIEQPLTFAGFVDSGLNQIRQVACSNVAVTLRLLEVIGDVGEHVHDEDDRAALLRQATMIERASRGAIAEEWDLQDIQNRYLSILDALGKADAALEAQAHE